MQVLYAAVRWAVKHEPRLRHAGRGRQILGNLGSTERTNVRARKMAQGITGGRACGGTHIMHMVEHMHVASREPRGGANVFDGHDQDVELCGRMLGRERGHKIVCTHHKQHRNCASWHPALYSKCVLRSASGSHEQPQGPTQWVTPGGHNRGEWQGGSITP